MGDRCSDCGAEVPAAGPSGEQTPCSACGSTKRTRALSAAAEIGLTVSDSIEIRVNRAVNESRMGAFTTIITVALAIGLAVGFGRSSAVVGIVAGLGAAILTALLIAAIYRVAPVRHAVMDVMHRITGQ